MSIEEIAKLNKKISFYKIVYTKYKNSWLVIGFIPLFISFLMIGYCFLTNFKLEKIYCLVFGMLGLIFSTIYIRKKNYEVIKKNYRSFMEDGNKWNYLTINKIRNEIIRNELEKYIKLDNNNISFLIETLKNDIEISKYDYVFLKNSFIICLSVSFGAFLGGLSNFTTDLKDFTYVFLIIFKIIPIIILFIIYFEKILLKQLTLDFRKRKYCLIRALENIYIENNTIKYN